MPRTCPPSFEEIVLADGAAARGATARTRDATIGDHLDVVDLAVDHASGSVNLIGDCRGAVSTRLRLSPG